jgi:ubiquinone/menaquinone biosynthesis C-methylase UbiE
MIAHPEQNIVHLGLKEGMQVADLGSGTGAYVKAARKRVGHTGTVYAVEVQKGLVKKLEDEMKESGISNVQCIWGDIEKEGGTNIASGTLDAAILANVLFQVQDKLGLIDEAKRILKKGGKVLLVDWKESSPTGPGLHHVVPLTKAEELFHMRGFTSVETISENEYQYGIIFTRNE